MKFLAVSALAAVASAQNIPYTTTPLVVSTLPYTSALPYTPLASAAIPAIPAGPPRFMNSPGIQVYGLPPLPDQYSFPYEQTTINTSTGLLTRNAGTPLPPVENLVKWEDGQWYQAPTNSWEYTGSPLQPYNQPEARSPFALRTPALWALLVNDNMVNLSTGEVWNNLATPVPQLQIIPENNIAYAVPRDPFQFTESPLQPYNRDVNIQKPTQIPPMVPGGEIGFKQGYNPNTIDILKEIQGLSLNYNYDLNSPAVTQTQQIGVVGQPGVPVI